MDKVSSLSPEIKHIVVDKGTEPEHSGCLLAETGEGSYICRRCGTALYRSHDKFDSGCGWPSFDDEIEGVIKTQDDPIEGALEIMCKECDAH